MELRVLQMMGHCFFPLLQVLSVLIKLKNFSVILHECCVPSGKNTMTVSTNCCNKASTVHTEKNQRTEVLSPDSVTDVL